MVRDIVFDDKRVIKLIELIKKQIEGTVFKDKVFLVGGVVRDSLLGLKVKDVDIVVEYENGGVLLATLLATINKCYKATTNPVIFPSYGTAKLRLTNDDDLKDLDIEFVQTRKEQYRSDSRNPETVFGSKEEDAKRRDLTINSIYYNISKDELCDPNGGVDDLVNMVIRTPSNPDLVFNDDPLRILRVIRFSCRFGWDIEKSTWLGMIKNARRLSIITQERITNEINGIITSENPSMGIKKMMYCGVLRLVLPDIQALAYAKDDESGAFSVLDHTMSVIDKVSDNSISRFAALFHDVSRVVTQNETASYQDTFSSEVAHDELKKMKLPNDAVNSIAMAIKNHRYFDTYEEGELPNDKRIRKFVNEVGDDLAPTMELMHANNMSTMGRTKPTQVLGILSRIERLGEVDELKEVKLPISGNDIMKEFNLKSGPHIGKLMNMLKEAYFENPNITKEECFKIIENELKETK